jgi:hypothetical protein
MPTERINLSLSLTPAGDVDTQELSELTQNLRRVLKDSEADTVEPMRGGHAPEGAKALDPITLGNFAITIAPVALQGLIKIIQSWVTRHDRASITIKTNGGDTLVVTGDPSAAQKQVADDFENRHRS